MNIVVSLVCVGGLAGTALAQPVQFLATDGDRLYRGDLSGNVQPFVSLSVAVQSLTRIPEGFSVTGASAGDIIATARSRTSGAWAVYRLDDPFGAASLTQIGSTTFGVGSLAFSSQGLFAVDDSNNPLRVSKLDMTSFSVLQSYSTGVNISGGGGIAGAPGSSQFYLTDYTNNRLLSWIPGGAATVIGSTGLGFSNNGLEYLNGTLYGALRRDTPSTQMEVGTFDISTGAFSSATTITGILGNGTGFVTIPTPAGSVLLGLCGVIAGRRRRRTGSR